MSEITQGFLACVAAASFLACALAALQRIIAPLSSDDDDEIGGAPEGDLIHFPMVQDGSRRESKP
ncbi:MAG: hypothetical protein QM636_23150 [Rhizobium sp.]